MKVMGVMKKKEEKYQQVKESWVWVVLQIIQKPEWLHQGQTIQHICLTLYLISDFVFVSWLNRILIFNV